MKTILLLTNFTEISSRAIERFMLVFGPKILSSSKFVLLNAWRQPRTGRFQLINLDEYLGEISGNELKLEQEKLLNLFPGNRPKIRIESKQGDIVAVLNRVCETHKPDLIVMGTKGSNIWRELLAGRTTGRIVRKARAPVLIIPESADFKFPQRIVLASEMKKCKNEKEFIKLTAIVRLFMSEFIILHIYKDERPDTEAFENCMKKYLEGITYQFQYKSNLRVAEAIIEFSNNMKADLLAMICHDENLLVKILKHSVSTRLTQMAEIPMLIIHE
jgi:nucleotide-binding universal stress UspA family protein